MATLTMKRPKPETNTLAQLRQADSAITAAESQLAKLTLEVTRRRTADNEEKSEGALSRLMSGVLPSLRAKPTAEELQSQIESTAAEIHIAKTERRALADKIREEHLAGIREEHRKLQAELLDHIEAAQKKILAIRELRQSAPAGIAIDASELPFPLGAAGNVWGTLQNLNIADMRRRTFANRSV